MSSTGKIFQGNGSYLKSNLKNSYNIKPIYHSLSNVATFIDNSAFISSIKYIPNGNSNPIIFAGSTSIKSLLHSWPTEVTLEGSPFPDYFTGKLLISKDNCNSWNQIQVTIADRYSPTLTDFTWRVDQVFDILPMSKKYIMVACLLKHDISYTIIPGTAGRFVSAVVGVYFNDDMSVKSSQIIWQSNPTSNLANSVYLEDIDYVNFLYYDNVFDKSLTYITKGDVVYFGTKQGNLMVIMRSLNNAYPYFDENNNVFVYNPDMNWVPTIEQNFPGVTFWGRPVLDMVNDPPLTGLSSLSRYIVGANPTGAFVGHANQIAYYVESTASWAYDIPYSGWATYAQTPNKTYLFTDYGWIEYQNGFIYYLNVYNYFTYSNQCFIDMKSYIKNNNKYFIVCGNTYNSSGSLKGQLIRQNLTTAGTIDRFESDVGIDFKNQTEILSLGMNDNYIFVGTQPNNKLYRYSLKTASETFDEVVLPVSDWGITSIENFGYRLDSSGNLNKSNEIFIGTGKNYYSTTIEANHGFLLYTNSNGDNWTLFQNLSTAKSNYIVGNSITSIDKIKCLYNPISSYNYFLIGDNAFYGYSLGNFTKDVNIHQGGFDFKGNQFNLFLNDNFLSSGLTIQSDEDISFSIPISSAPYTTNTESTATIQLTLNNFDQYTQPFDHYDNSGNKVLYPNVSRTVSDGSVDDVKYRHHLTMINEPFQISAVISNFDKWVAVPKENIYFSIGLDSAYKVNTGKVPYRLTREYYPDILSFNDLFNVDKFYYQIETESWTQGFSSSTVNNSPYLSANFSFPNLTLDNNFGLLSVPKFKPTVLDLNGYVVADVKFPGNKIKTYPGLHFDWMGLPNQPTDYTATYKITSTTTTQQITTFPLYPVIYTPNKYVLKDETIWFQNTVTKYPDKTNGISAITWEDRNNVFVDPFDLTHWTTQQYVTSFDSAGTYGLGVSTIMFDNNYIYSQKFDEFIYVLNDYITYDPLIVRYFGYSNLYLPNSKPECYIGPNEWVVAETVNQAFDRLQENFEYLSKVTKVYDVPPTEYIGWLGTYGENTYSFHWHLTTVGINDFFESNLSASNTVFDKLQDCVVRDNIHYIVGETFVDILSSDLFATPLIPRKTERDYGMSFGKLHSVALDQHDDRKLFVLDTLKNEVIVLLADFTTQKWTTLYSWGKLGGENSKNGFRNPNDLSVDSENNVWIADTGNYCVKKYSNAGNWMNTIYLSEEYKGNSKPLSVVANENKNIFILMDNKSILKYDYQFNFIKKIDLNVVDLKYSYPKTIRTCVDGGFVYVCFNNKIVKVAVEGTEITNIENKTTIVGMFPENSVDYKGSSFESIWHDEHRNLYITNGNHILKYTDMLVYLDLRANHPSEKFWDMNDNIYVNKEEYIQDWVFNKALNRYWDNIEQFRRGLRGKFDYYNINGVYRPFIRTFKNSEYSELPWKKEEIFVGINELVTFDVINRCIGKLWDCQQTILEMVKE